MIANHPFAKRTILNALDENGQPGCAVCGRPPESHRRSPYPIRPQEVSDE